MLIWLSIDGHKKHVKGRIQQNWSLLWNEKLFSHESTLRSRVTVTATVIGYVACRSCLKLSAKKEVSNGAYKYTVKPLTPLYLVPPPFTSHHKDTSFVPLNSEYKILNYPQTKPNRAEMIESPIIQLRIVGFWCSVIYRCIMSSRKQQNN